VGVWERIKVKNMELKIKGILGLGLGIALTAVAATSKAETVTAKLNGLAGVNGTITANTNTEAAGVGGLLWTDAVWAPTAETSATPNFWSFCIQATTGHNISFGTTYTMTMGTLETTPDLGLNTGTGTAAAKALAIEKMFQWLHDSGPGILTNANTLGLSADQAAGLQLAVWEIVYDGVTGSAGTFTDGNFKIVNDVNTAAAIGYANTYLGHTNNTTFMVLSGLAGTQDQAIGLPPLAPVVPLPAPAVAIIGLLCLNGAGLWYGKRRRRVIA
jgi:hypothetical protein